jgi:hypothetical protein
MALYCIILMTYIIIYYLIRITYCIIYCIIRIIRIPSCVIYCIRQTYIVLIDPESNIYADCHFLRFDHLYWASINIASW